MIVKPRSVEFQVGMSRYVTASPPCQGKIRVAREDFHVSEMMEAEGLISQPNEGYLPLYRVEKFGMDTFHVARILSAELRSRLSYAGLKDRRAHAVQYMTPTSIHCQRPPVVKRPGFVAELVGYVPHPISRRMMTGNSFKIVIREACQRIEESVGEVYSACSARMLPNYFGLQRFGARDPNTHEIGKQLILGRFDEAIKRLVFHPRNGESELAREAREKAAGGEYQAAEGLFTREQDLERIIVKRLARRPEDFLGAFRSLPIAIRRFFVHAYESYLFNRTLSEALLNEVDISKAVAGDNWSRLASDGLTLHEVHGAKERPAGDAIPLAQLVGYAYRDYGSRLDRCTSRVLEEEGVNSRQFYVREAQEVSAEGGFRRVPLVARDLGFALGSEGALLSFALARGEYATTLLREVLKPDDPVSSGFGS